MCGSIGRLVKNKTVEYIGGYEKDVLKKEIMSVCMDADCEIVYFSSIYYPLIFERELSIEIDFKYSSGSIFLILIY